MWKILAAIGATLVITCHCVAGNNVITGAQCMNDYLPLLEGKRVGILTNHTGTVDGVHLVDTLLARGIDVTVVFAPEHGFRGDADAGENVASYTDARTGIEVVSIYGPNKEPRAEDVRKADVIVFDIQDVGLRYYTYLSSMHYMMKTCAGTGKRLVVLDRPNPNGMYVDGPILEERYRSFVGMHPIPVVHGMTLGELARMINGEGWLGDGVRCKLTVVPCRGYIRSMRYELPVKPSPNLPNMRSVYLYPSLCYFEATPVSIGRGTHFPFQVYGHPALKGAFDFTPRATEGARNPPQKDKLCHGVDLRGGPTDEQLIAAGINLDYVIGAYRALGLGEKFFTPMFECLIGVAYVRQMIMAGAEADEIRARWSDDVARFREQRKPYLLYEE
ncbi:MAG: DUF1343 domain-containing protein [Rikenellaceae bacterium]|nr:DUF1343 domain-containing protein [Rikenellaceae bacterium]